MNSALRRGQLQEAWRYSDAVLENHSDDPDTLAMVAELAHRLEKPVVAAELLVKSCRAESFADAKRVQQAMIGMIGIGRFHDGIELLEEAVEQQPMQHETRRWLYDFYIGSEDRNAGVPHGRFLVRQRQFDVQLLTSLSNTERRTKEDKPLNEMVSRNPDDKRPLLGDARHKFDQREFKEAAKLLESIVQSHPDYLPAQALLGRALAGAGDFQELEKWSVSQSESIESYSDYWLALGDWARAKKLPDQAARAYWEATRRDPDVLESWSKLSNSLRQLQSAGQDLPNGSLESVDARAAALSTFNQLKQKFDRTGGISRETAVEIVKTLRDLGRLWEAEAWGAIALTLPEDDEVPAAEVRESVVKMLDDQTPWQLLENHPEFQIDFASLDLPAISNMTDLAKVDQRESRAGSTDFSLLNEAETRGVRFFGRTSDKLDQPGIILYQTLGCGGGTLDYDLDGWSDLYLLAAGGTPPARDSAPNALLRNLQGSFAEVTLPARTGDTGFGQGVAVGDINEDGFPDLLVLNYGPDTLLVNNGDGTFTDASYKLDFSTETAWSTSAAIADVDGDAISDLVIVNYCTGIDPVTVTCPMKDSDLSRSCTPMLFTAASDSFLQGTSQGTFIDKTEQWQAIPSVVGRGLGIVAGALDKQPGVDLFVANDMTNNHYWNAISDDEFRLGESAMLRGLGGDDRALAQGSMGIATGDLDRDGDTDIYVTNFDKEYNTFHEQGDSGLWQDRTSSLQLTEPTMPLVGFGAEAVDLNHDGNLELLVANGHVDMFSRGDERSLYAHPMQLFQRNGSGTYDSIAPLMSGRYMTKPHVGRALWTIDADRDARTDFVVTHQTEPVALLINHSKSEGDWLEINLVGRSCARDAIGSVVRVSSGDQLWVASKLSGDGYLCSNERVIRLGLGDLKKREVEMEVTWPDGSRQQFPALATNRRWMIVQTDESAFQMK